MPGSRLVERDGQGPRTDRPLRPHQLVAPPLPRSIRALAARTYGDRPAAGVRPRCPRPGSACAADLEVTDLDARQHLDGVRADMERVQDAVCVRRRLRLRA